MLEDTIEAFAREITADMLETICQNLTKRTDHLRRTHGKHLLEKINDFMNFFHIFFLFFEKKS